MSTTTVISIREKKSRLFPARGAWAGSTGAACSATIVTFLTTLTAVPSGVVLTVLKVGEIKDAILDNTL